jgi:hypothetical protein
MRAGNDVVSTVAASLHDYVTRHPDAADSIEGIRRWWLPPGLVASTAEVQAALDRLVAAGVLSERPLPDRGTLYSRRRP